MIKYAGIREGKAMTGKPIFAIMYDFDRTLCPKDMQEYQFIPSLGLTAQEFWSAANTYAEENGADKILSYMYMMITQAKERGYSLTRQKIVSCGENIEFFPGIPEWFDNISRFGEDNGVQIEHYVLSSGLTEIIEGSGIGGYFKKIYASEFMYNDYGIAVFPKSAVNYTSKTQFIYRINKGVFDISNDDDLNRSTPDNERRVSFSNMLYIGDGLSDVPCMKMVKAYGGSSIAVYHDERGKQIATDMLAHDRVDYIFPTDYRSHSGLELTVKYLIMKSSIESLLGTIHDAQVNGEEY